LGSGESSGHGKTCGKGHKGQKARSGGSIRLGFEGGQMPLIRRIPKRGFNNANFKTKFAVVNVGALNRFEAGSTVDEGSLLSLGMIRRPYDAIKILGVGKLSTKLNVVANGASSSARAAIESAGGTLVIK
jgi:large subunit ribosomal protein L15